MSWEPPNHDYGTRSSVGAVYVFEREGDSWGQTAEFLPLDAFASVTFGSSVAISQNRILVGTPLDDPFGILNAGAAYLITKSSSGWSEVSKLIPSDPSTQLHFGSAVAVSGNQAFVGVPNASEGTTFGIGAAYWFDLGCTPCSGDADGDFDVDLSDLGIVLGAFSACPGDSSFDSAADLDNNGCIDLSDLGIILANFGSTCGV